MINGRYRDGWHTEREVELFQYGTRWSFPLPQWFRDAISRRQIIQTDDCLTVYTCPKLRYENQLWEGGIVAYMGDNRIIVVSTGSPYGPDDYTGWRDRFTLIKLADHGPYEPSKTFDAAD